MEEEVIQSPNIMVLGALAVLGVVLGGAGLYFGLTANQRVNSIDQSVEASTTSSAKNQKLIYGFDTRISELMAQVEEQSSVINRLRIYSSQGEQAMKKLASEVRNNREQIVKTAEELNSFAAMGFRPVSAAPEVSTAESANADAAEGAPTTVLEPGTTYVIVSGDNFAKIAAKAGVSLQAILEANPDADPRRLLIGQTIQIPPK